MRFFESETHFYEAYTASVRKLVVAAAPHCQICQERTPKKMRVEAHSATKLHLKRMPDGTYISQSTTQGHARMCGYPFTHGFLTIEWGLPHDGVKLCVPCHKEIGRILWAEAKLEGLRGITPALSEETTFGLVARGKPITGYIALG